MEPEGTYVERTWIARIVGVRPDLVETETDDLITIPNSKPAFLVTINPGSAGIIDPGEVALLLCRGQREQRLVFQIGRAIVYAFNNAWGSPVLVEDLLTLLIRQQAGGPVPTLRSRSRIWRALRVMRAWVRSLLATPAETEPVGGAATERPEPTGGVVAVSRDEVSDPVATTAWGPGRELS